LQDILPLRPERIFIEATGLADPVQVRYDMAMLGIPVGLTLCVVDAQNFLQEQRLSITAQHQVRTSNIILLARQDCATPAERETTLALIAELNPRAPILHLSHGKLSAEARVVLFAEQHALDKEFDPLQEHLVRDAISAYTLALTNPLTFDQIHSLLQALPANVLRCKGRAMLLATGTQAEPYMINAVCGSWDYFPLTAPMLNNNSSLFLIGYSVEQSVLQASLQAALGQSGYNGALHIKQGMIRSIGVPHNAIR
jgi:G3E family GTPase